MPPEKEKEQGFSPEIERLSSILAKDPKSRLFMSLAEEYLKAGMVEEAIATLTDGLRMNPHYAGARVVLGKAFLAKGEAGRACAEFEEVLKAAPDNLIALKKLGEIYRSQGRLADASRSYKMIALLNPKDEDARQALIELEGTSKPGFDAVLGARPQAPAAGFQEIKGAEPEAARAEAVFQDFDLSEAGEPDYTVPAPAPLDAADDFTFAAQPEAGADTFVFEDEAAPAAEADGFGIQETGFDTDGFGAAEPEGFGEAEPMGFDTPEAADFGTAEPGTFDMSGDEGFGAAEPFEAEADFGVAEALPAEAEAEAPTMEMPTLDWGSTGDSGDESGFAIAEAAPEDAAPAWEAAEAAPAEEMPSLDALSWGDEPVASAETDADAEFFDAPEAVPLDEATPEMTLEPSVEDAPVWEMSGPEAAEAPGAGSKKASYAVNADLDSLLSSYGETGADAPRKADDGAYELNVSAPGGFQAHAEAEPQAGQKEQFSTETLAELYVSQGFFDRAINIYKNLLQDNPGNQRIIRKIEELNALALGAGAEAAHEAVPVIDESPALSPEPETFAEELPSFDLPGEISGGHAALAEPAFEPGLAEPDTQADLAGDLPSFDIYSEPAHAADTFADTGGGFDTDAAEAVALEPEPVEVIEPEEVLLEPEAVEAEVAEAYEPEVVDAFEAEVVEEAEAVFDTPAAAPIAPRPAPRTPGGPQSGNRQAIERLGKFLDNIHRRAGR